MFVVDYLLPFAFVGICVFLAVTTLTGWSAKFKFMDQITNADWEFRRGLGIVTTIMSVIGIWVVFPNPTPKEREYLWSQVYKAEVALVKQIDIVRTNDIDMKPEHEVKDDIPFSLSEEKDIRRFLKALHAAEPCWPNHPTDRKFYKVKMIFVDSTQVDFSVGITPKNGTLIRAPHLRTTRSDELKAILEQYETIQPSGPNESAEQRNEGSVEPN